MLSADKCIHCHKCRENCAFLTKYCIDICDIERLRELAYHCFLCGRCTEVCPVGIDGRGLIMSMRQERASSEEKSQIEKTYKENASKMMGNNTRQFVISNVKQTVKNLDTEYKNRVLTEEDFKKLTEEPEHKRRGRPPKNKEVE